MDKELSKEINELLVDHGEALTAFYDEGLSYGEAKGYLKGVAMTALAVAYWKLSMMIANK